MQPLTLLVLALGLVAFALVSRRAQRSAFTAPMAFVAFGFLVSQHGLGLVEFGLEDEWIHLLAELTLVFILFTDASRIDLAGLRREHDLPLRLLAIGLPLTIVAGTAVALLVFSNLSLWEAALLAAILAPTDAALGQAVVSSKQVPVRMRQALNVESGLNDGIVFPLVLILFSLACATAEPESAGYWIRFTLLQVTLGPAVGVAVGYFGGRLIELGSRTEWMSPIFRDLATLALALVAFGGAELVHGNGFIAAFCAGMTLGNTSKVSEGVQEFAEAEGQLLTLMVFTVFGALTVPLILQNLNAQIVLYAVLSLTVIRMIPVVISLLGRGLRWESVLFVGWFGPRGIASILFALLIVDGEAGAVHDHLLPVIMTTVALSVFAHGMSAFAGTRWYAARIQQTADDPGACEHKAVSEMPIRTGGDRSE